MRRDDFRITDLACGFVRTALLVAGLLPCSVVMSTLAQEDAVPQPPISMESISEGGDFSLVQSYRQALARMREEGNLSQTERDTIHNVERTLEEGKGGEKDLFSEFYFIQGNEGVPFPDKTLLMKLREQSMTPTPMPTVEETPQPTPTPWAIPKRCATAGRESVEHHSEGDQNEILYDLIFVPHDMIPMEPTEVYGRHVNIVPYQEGKGDAAVIKMKLYGVPCLPYRIRMTATKYYYDTGINALKNYDSDPTGNGTMHPWISNMLYGSPNNKANRKRNRSKR